MKKLLNLTDKHVGSRVRMRRLMLDLSQSALATALGVTIQQMQKYEKGANRISASRLHHISDVLQVPNSLFLRRITAPLGCIRADDRRAVQILCL